MFELDKLDQQVRVGGSLEQKRAAIIYHYENGKRKIEMFKVLKKLNLDYNLVNRTIKRFQETGSTKKCKRKNPTRPKRTPAMLKELKETIRRNPGRSLKKLALQMNVSRQTIKRALKIDLGLKALKRGNCHMLTIPQKEARVKKCKALLRRHGVKKVERILFMDEKIFTIEESFN